jgi:hypothetical protein
MPPKSHPISPVRTEPMSPKDLYMPESVSYVDCEQNANIPGTVSFNSFDKSPDSQSNQSIVDFPEIRRPAIGAALRTPSASQSSDHRGRYR